MAYKDCSVQSYFLNVGVGDSAVHLLLKGKDVQEAVLIDGGRAAAATTLITNLEEISGLCNFDLKFRSIVVTHWDNDHYGGLLKMLFTDWEETHNKNGSTYIGPNTVFYCPSTALDKFGEHNKIDIKKMSGKYVLYFREKMKDGSYEEYPMCKAVLSTYCIGYDLFSGAHYRPLHKPLKPPEYWPVESLVPVFQECEALKGRTRPIFLVVGIDGLFINGAKWVEPKSTWKSQSEERNASSIMAIVVWPTTNMKKLRVSLYTGGDAEMVQEQQLIDWLDAAPNATVSVDVVKAGHHGSHEATKERLLTMYLQRFIITAGSEYGHPSFAVVYVFLVVAEYCKSQGAPHKPKILCTRAPYWLAWRPDQLTGTDINLSNVIGWSDNAAAIQKAIQLITKKKFKSFIFDHFSDAMRCMMSYYAYARTQEQFNTYMLHYADSPLSQVTGWKQPVLPKGKKADYFYEQAIMKVWDIMKPLWSNHGEPVIDDGRGVQFIMVEAFGNKPLVKHEMQDLTWTVAKEIKESLLSSLRPYDREFLHNLNTARTGTNNRVYNSLAKLVAEDMKKTLMELDFLPSSITEENTAVEQWTVGLLSEGLKSKADLSDMFSGICLDKSQSACGAWFSACFNKAVKMIFTGKKAKDSGIILDRLDVELELGSNVNSISFPLESGPVITLTTSCDSRISQFGDNAKDEQQTELGFDSRLEGMLLALEVASSSTNISFEQFCDLINYPLSPSIRNLLKPLVLQPLPQSRSGLWFVPKYISRTIMRIAMKPNAQDGVGSEVQTLFEFGLGPLSVSNVAVIGTCVAEGPSIGLIETSSKLSIEADLSLKQKSNASTPPFEGRARITFTNKGWEVALKCKKGELLKSLLTWAESIVKNSKGSQNNGGSETPRLFESESTAKKTEEALRKVTSEDADINLHTALLAFDNEMNIESFQINLEISMVLQNTSIPFLATLSWKHGVFALSCRLWPKPSFGQLPELLHPYYESTAVADPFDSNPTYKLPLKDLLRMPDAYLPPGIPNTIVDAWMEVSFGVGPTTAAVSATIKCDPKQGEKDQGSGPPLFQLDEVDMSVGLAFLSSSGLPEVSAFFDAAITLAIPDAHRPDASKTDIDKYIKIKVAFEYDRTNEEQSLWVTRSRIQNVTVANIYQLFSTDGSNDAILDVMASIRILNAEMWYEHRSEGPNALKLNGSILLGPPGGDNSVQLDLHYSHDKGSWSFDAQSRPEAGEKDEKPFRVVNMLSGLVEDEAELPEFLRNLEVPLNTLKAHLSCSSTVDSKGNKYVVFSLSISIGSFIMTLAQVRSFTAAKARVAAVKATGNDTESGDGHSKPTRLLRFELSELLKVPSVPVIGATPQPFDSLGIVWTNRDITATEIEVLNSSVFKEQHPLQVKESKNGVGSLIAGCHFQISLLEGSQPKIVLDHCIGGDKTSEKAERNTTDAVVGHDEQNPEKEDNEEPDPAPEPRAPDTSRSVAPMTKTFGPISVRSIGLAVEDKSLSTINISLDASVRLGPVTMALLGFSFNIDFNKIKDPRDLKDLISNPRIDGMAVSLENPPTRLAGTFVSFKESSTEGFMGAIAVSLKAWSAIAGGVYAENKIDLTKSVFAFALLRGPIFSFGCAEVVGLTGGFGYNSQLALPELSQLPEFPFIALNSTTGVPGKVMDQLATLRGGEGKKGWVTMASDDMWFVGGIGLKAFQTVDAQILLSLALSSEPKFTVLAQATAIFPRSLEIDPNAQNPLANAFLVLDIVLRADIDPFHGSILAAGELTPKSFILNPSCHLTGGFALAYFLSGSPHEGDFVFTVGGYHPHYTPPAHYPAAVKRVGIRWEIDPQLRLSGEAYFALIPQVAMGGGRLDVVLDKGWLRAVFSAYANFMMHFHPFQFDIEVSIALVAEVILPAVLFTLHLGPLEFSATLTLRGPPVSGVANLHLWRWDVEVMFGQRRVEAKALQWGQFLRMVKNLPIEAADDKADAVPHHILTVTKGAVTAEKKTERKEDKGGGIYSTPVETKLTSEPESTEIRGTEFGFELQTRVPVLSAIIGTDSEVELPGASELFARPMQLQFPIKVSRLVVTLTRDETSKAVPLSGKPIQKRVGPVLWGKYDNSPDSAAKAASESMLSHVMGYEILVQDQLPSDEDLPTIDISQFNAIEVGGESDNGIPSIESAQDIEDDHLFSLVQDHGPHAMSQRLVLEDPQNELMELAKLEALEAWSSFRRHCERGGISRPI